jgi:anti-sigma factor RsiW
MRSKSQHSDVQVLLPWLVNGSLAPTERDKVLSHLMSCGACRRERDRLQALQELVKEDMDQSDYRFSFNRVLRRIEAGERDRQSLQVEDALAKRRLAGRWIPLASVAAGFVFAVIFALNLETSDMRDGFRTLSSAQDTSGLPHEVRLTVDGGLSSHELRQLLSTRTAAILSGPDEAGTYHVVMDVPASMTDAEFLGSVSDLEGVAHAEYAGHP